MECEASGRGETSDRPLRGGISALCETSIRRAADTERRRGGTSTFEGSGSCHVYALVALLLLYSHHTRETSRPFPALDDSETDLSCAWSVPRSPSRPMAHAYSPPRPLAHAAFARKFPTVEWRGGAAVPRSGAEACRRAPSCWICNLEDAARRRGSGGLAPRFAPFEEANRIPGFGRSLVSSSPDRWRAAQEDRESCSGRYPARADAGDGAALFGLLDPLARHWAEAGGPSYALAATSYHRYSSTHVADPRCEREIHASEWSQAQAWTPGGNDCRTVQCLDERLSFGQVDVFTPAADNQTEPVVKSDGRGLIFSICRLFAPGLRTINDHLTLGTRRVRRTADGDPTCTSRTNLCVFLLCASVATLIKGSPGFSGLRARTSTSQPSPWYTGTGGSVAGCLQYM